MPSNPSIYNLLRQPKSVAEYGAEMDAAEANKIGLQTSRANLIGVQQAQADEQAMRSLYAQPDFDPRTDAGVGQLLRVNPKAGYAAQKANQEYSKGALDQDKTRADIKKTGADTVKTQIDAAGDKLKQFRAQLDYVDSPQTAARWLQAQFQDPLLAEQMGALGTFEEAVTRIPQDPAAFQQWRQQAAMGMEAHMKQKVAEAAQVETGRSHRANEAGTIRGQDISASTARRGQDISAGTTIRGQNMTDSRARDLNEITRGSKADDKRAAVNEKGVTDFAKTLQKEGVPELETAVAGAEGALNRYPKGKVPGIGAVKNMLPAAVMSDEGKDVRQSLAQVRNIVLSARSGAAVTDQELRRLVEEIGTGVGMSEDDVRKGLAKVRERIDSIKTNAAAGVNDEVLTEYQNRGGIPIKRGAKSAGGASGGWTVKEVK